jgi:hypothetical protein
MYLNLRPERHQLLKLQRLKNKVFHTNGNFPRRTSVIFLWFSEYRILIIN